VLAFELLFGQRPFEKHCPSLHIAYLEESLKRTATRSVLRKELQRVSDRMCIEREFMYREESTALYRW
jgi:hypothetical protein